MAEHAYVAAIRPGEPEDLAALRALGVAAHHGADDVLVASLASPPPHVHHLVWAPAGVPRAWLRIVLRTRPRMRHGAKVDLAGEPEGVDALLAEAEDLATRWFALVCMEVELPDGDPLAERLAAAGWTSWVRRTGGWRQDGSTRDQLTWGWLRPGFPPPPVPAAPPARPPRDPLPGLVVRRPTPADAAAITSILRDPATRWGTLQVGTVPAAWWRERLAGADGHQSYVVEHEGMIIANGGFHAFPAPRAHCSAFGMSVAGVAQGRGAGGLLLDAIVAGARDAGHARLELEVWTENHRAEALYRSRGFVPEGVSPYAGWSDGGWTHSRHMVLRFQT